MNFISLAFTSHLSAKGSKCQFASGRIASVYDDFHKKMFENGLIHLNSA
jgi:hypothetical protein